MAFDQGEWVNEMAVTTVAGLIAAWVTVIVIPEAPKYPTFLVGGLGGFLQGALNQPLRILLNRRPKALPDSPIGKEDQHVV